MLDILFLIFIVAVLCFGFVLMFGAPYLPTHRKQTYDALDLLGLKEGQVLYELGCGDGRLLRAAAERNIQAVGYELNPILFVVAWLSTRKYGRCVRVVFGNFWQADMSGADGVYVFLLGRFMQRLDKKLASELRPGTKVVSYTFKISAKKPAKEQGGLYLYRY